MYCLFCFIKLKQTLTNLDKSLVCQRLFQVYFRFRKVKFNRSVSMSQLQPLLPFYLTSIERLVLGKLLESTHFALILKWAVKAGRITGIKWCNSTSEGYLFCIYLILLLKSTKSITILDIPNKPKVCQGCFVFF